MSRIEEAKHILQAFGLPARQQNDMSALTLLALCGIGPDDSWPEAKRNIMTVSLGIMAFMRDKYGKVYAPNTRETIRRQVLHQFIQAQIVDYNPDKPERPTNSPKASYAISEAALKAIQSFETSEWNENLQSFLKAKARSLTDVYQQERAIHRIPVQLPSGHTLDLSPGKHNQLQAAIIEQFSPFFAPGAFLLYLGDAAKKNLLLDAEKLTSLRIPITKHDKLPDIILYDEGRNRLFLIEAVTSHGPMSPTRVQQLRELLAECPVNIILVTAFPNLAEFKKHLGNIAWETEVWIAESPDHLIHFNGEQFLGPH